MRGRRAQILVEVVDRYIRTKKPVSSQEIVQVYGHRLSSATIRNELHALEEEGYLYKPHVSAGRVPTVQGFRFFAQWLLAVAETEPKEAGLPMEPQPASALPPLPELLRRTALLLSGMTGALGFVVPPSQEEVGSLGVVLREIRPGLLLAATVSELGVMEARLLSAPLDLGPEAPAGPPLHLGPTPWPLGGQSGSSCSPTPPGDPGHSPGLPDLRRGLAPAPFRARDALPGVGPGESSGPPSAFGGRSGF
ncbi:MAG: hypothetical protein ACPLRP_05135, partial [Candidatus Bipolaricaulaceae bacterium]